MEKRPFVVEILGPAGAGKTAVSAVLNSRGAGIKAGITVWGLPLYSLMLSGFTSLPDLIRLGFDRWRVNTEELKQVVRLTALHRLLMQDVNGDPVRWYTALFLDEGIIFELAKPRADIGIGLTNGGLKRWEQNMLDRWSGTLDAVIWLDAPDTVLVERIRTRAKHHRMKNEPDHEIFDFLKRYRAAFEFVISELMRRGNIQVARIRTEDLDAETLADEILEITDTVNMPNKAGHTTLTVARGIENEQAV